MGGFAGAYIHGLHKLRYAIIAFWLIVLLGGAYPVSPPSVRPRPHRFAVS